MFDQNNPDSLLAIGLMSGTSMDGVDLAACAFEYKDGRWDFTLKKAVTIPYPDEWIKVMQSLPTVPAQEVFRIDAALGKYFGLLINDFITDLPEKPRLIGSHGHTLFHQPEAGFTTQVGSGAHIAAVTGIDTICDFRSKDVALGGHGAPLVPVGDHYLFPQYEACLNLGGFANISMLDNGKRIAYDICPVNMPLNALAERTNNRYDHHGELARSGTILPELLEKLNRLDFYTKSGAKSLGREWYEINFLPLLNEGNPADLSRTVCEHIALMHAKAFQPISTQGNILVTGGGAHHTFLLERMAALGNKNLTIPEEGLVNFKEAIVFAFLGVLNYLGRVNVFDSATGSVKQHVGGALYRGD